MWPYYDTEDWSVLPPEFNRRYVCLYQCAVDLYKLDT